MSSVDDPQGICWGKTGFENVWESPPGATMRDGDLEVHAWARRLCLMCPVLEACEAYLSDQERAGNHIDGVIAARYSDVCAPGTFPDRRQTHCSGCGKAMRPQRERGLSGVAKKRHKPPRRKHVGEGLCDKCYPRLSRRGV